LDGPPIHIRPIIPAISGCKQRTIQAQAIAAYAGWHGGSLNRNGFFAESVKSQAIRD
jgi:hypothetical protein